MFEVSSCETSCKISNDILFGETNFQAKFRWVFRNFVECFEISFVFNKAEVKFRSFPAMLWVNILRPCLDGNNNQRSRLHGNCYLHIIIIKDFTHWLHFISQQPIMPKVTMYTWNRIQSLHESCLQPVKIFQELKSEGLCVSYPSVARIVNKLKLTGSIENHARSGRPRKLNEAARTFIEEQMRVNDETTSCQIQKRLQKHGFTIHASTVRRSRKEQGWTLQNTRYCQMIREASKFIFNMRMTNFLENYWDFSTWIKCFKYKMQGWSR